MEEPEPEPEPDPEPMESTSPETLRLLMSMSAPELLKLPELNPFIKPEGRLGI